MIKTIIFDFDGVLVESVDIKTMAFKKLFEMEGHNDDDVRNIVEYHIQNTGVSRFEKIAYFYKEILKSDLHRNEFDRLCNRFSELVVDEVVNAPYVRGADEFLRKHSEDFKCYIASATPHDEMLEIINRRQMKQFFKKVYGSPMTKGNIASEIIIKNRCNKHETLFIGDALSDYNAARINGIQFIARTRGDVDIFKEVDCRKISDFSNFLNIVREL